jgi:anti-anti-sigma factor
MVRDVAVVEIRTKDIHGPQVAQELGTELALVTAQDWARRLLVNFHRVAFLSSTGFAALFKLVSRARAEGREVKLCDMEPGVRLGAEIVGLEKLVEIHRTERSALAAFAHA